MQAQAIETDRAAGPLGGTGQTLQEAGHLAQVLLAGRREGHALGGTQKQRTPDQRLQIGDLMAHRRRRQVELLGRPGNIAKASGLLEGLNCFQRWQLQRLLAWIVVHQCALMKWGLHGDPLLCRFGAAQASAEFFSA
ncbi:hypothetical protein D3C71_1621840 [compost metagenome]